MDPHHDETIESKVLLSGGIKVKLVHGIAWLGRDLTDHLIPVPLVPTRNGSALNKSEGAIGIIPLSR